MKASLLPQLVLAVVVSLLAGPSDGEEPFESENIEFVSFVEQSLASHPTAEAARAEVAAARSELDGARMARLPGLSMESFADQSAGGRFVTALAVEQPIWSGGRIRAAIRQAQGRLVAAEARLDEVYLDLALQAVEAYVGAQTLRRRVEVLEGSLEEHQSLVRSMERRVEQQISPASDLDLARSRARQIEIDVVDARSGAEIWLLRLQHLVGDDDLAIRARLRMQDSSPPLQIAEILDAAMQFDPRRRLAAAEADIAGATASLSRSELMPHVSARYVYHLGETNLDDRLGLVVRFQPGSGFSRVAALNAAREFERAAQLGVDAAVRDQRERVLSALAESAAARQRAAAGREAALSAQSVTESFLRQFAAGRRTWPEVLNAVRERVTADLARVDAEGTAIAADLRLRLLTGGWRPRQPETEADQR